MHCMLKEVGLPGYEQCVSDFNGYDSALLGDIHERKFYPPNCYYSGSLLQRDHGESMNKGFGLLDISTKKYKFIDVI